MNFEPSCILECCRIFERESFENFFKNEKGKHDE